MTWKQLPLALQLYALLNEHQQKMEKALLEMGQFAQAYEQLMIWIGKTERVLNEVNYFQRFPSSE